MFKNLFVLLTMVVALVSANSALGADGTLADGTAAGPQADGSFEITVRTNLIGKNIVAVTNDGKFFAIVCKLGRFWSSAYLLSPTPGEGDLTTDDFNPTVAFVAKPRSDFAPLTTAAL